MKKHVIAVLFGGCSTEYEISLQSARAVLEHLDRQKYVPLPVGITKDGRWLHYTGPLAGLETDTWADDPAQAHPCMLSPDRGRHELVVLDGCITRLAFAAAFPVLHGKNGEDGTVQGLLELAGIPVIGCGTLAGALAMDKDRAHKLAQLAGVRVPASAVFDRTAEPDAIARAAARLGYPVFVKPVRAGSSFGVAKVSDPRALPEAVGEAFRHDGQVILEQTIEGFEVGCAVLGNDALTVGRVDEIELAHGFFDFTEKYNLITSRIHCPARIDRAAETRIQQAAQAVYRALGCRVFARVDLFLTPDGSIVFNEVNTIPGFTAHSRYPRMMQEIGLDFPALLDRMIALGLEGQA